MDPLFIIIFYLFHFFKKNYIKEFFQIIFDNRTMQTLISIRLKVVINILEVFLNKQERINVDAFYSLHQIRNNIHNITITIIKQIVVSIPYRLHLFIFLSRSDDRKNKIKREFHLIYIFLLKFFVI
jgi:hypothetical protein